jgi:hypothetical protein
MFSSSSLYLIQILLITIPTIAGWYRYKELEKGHQYFFFFLVLSFVFYVSNFMFLLISIKTIISYGWYAVSGFLLFQTLQAWETALEMKKISRLLAFLSPLIIAAEFIIRWSESIKIPSYAFMLISLVFSLMILPRLLDEFTSSKKIWKNSKVLILFPLIISFLLNVLLHVIYLLIFSPSTQIMLGQSSFIIRLFLFLSYFSFTIAMLWAPRKEIFI